MPDNHQAAQVSRSSRHDAHTQQSPDSFEYNDSNEKYIGKRTGNRFQRVQQKQHYDGFPRFSDYQTLGSNKSSHPQSSIQQSNQKSQQAFNFLSSTTKRDKAPQQKVEPQRDDEVVETKIQKEQQQRQTIQFEFKDPYDSHSYSQVGSSRLPNPNQPVNNNKAFGQISTIKRKTMSPGRRTSQHNTYKQLIDNLQEDLIGSTGVQEQQFLIEDPPNTLQIEEKKTVKEVNNNLIKKKKNSRVSFNQKTDFILNQSEVYVTYQRDQQKEDIDFQPKHDQRGSAGIDERDSAGIDWKKKKLEIEEPLSSGNNNSRNEKEGSVKQIKQVLDVEVNEREVKNIDGGDKAKKKKRKNSKPERVSSRIREQVIRQIRQSQEKKEKKLKKKFTTKQIQSKSQSITLSNSNRPPKNPKNNRKRTKVRLTQTTDSHPNSQLQVVSFSADQQPNARYPKRTRVKPLQFWDNQKIVYNTKGKAIGIKNLHLDIGKILGLRDLEQNAHLMSAKLIDIQTGQIQVQIKYPLSCELSFLGFSAPYISLGVQPTAELSHKNKQLMTQLKQSTSILIDDGVKYHQIMIVLNKQDKKRIENEWIEIGADTRFTIFSETKHEGSLESADNSNSQSNRIRNTHVTIRCRLTKKEREDHNQNLYER